MSIGTVPRLRPTWWALCLGTAAWSAYVSGLRRSSAGAVVAFAASLGVVVALAVLAERGRTRRRPYLVVGSATPRDATRTGAGLCRNAGFLLLALVATAWESLGIDTGPRRPHLTVSALAMAFRAFDAAVFLVWLLAGLFFALARATRPPAGALAAPTALLAPTPFAVGLLLPDDRAAGIAFWIVWLAAGIGLEIAGRRSSGRLATAEELVWTVSSSRLGTLACAAVWAYAGWHLFVH